MNHVPQIINTVHVCVAYEMKNKFLFFFSLIGFSVQPLTYIYILKKCSHISG